MNIVYEVNLAVDLDIARSYEVWLADHLREMVTFDGFESADWFERDAKEHELSLDQVHWTIHYRLRDRKTYADYISNHASRMRNEGIEKFGAAFQATRRVLKCNTSFPVS